MKPIIQAITANVYIFEGIAMALMSLIIFAFRRIKRLYTVAILLCLIFNVFAFWNFYLHFKNITKSEFATFILALAPFIVVALFWGRDSINSLLKQIGKFKWKDFEIEFDHAGSRLRDEIFPALTVDEMVFSRKQSIDALQREVLNAIRKLSWLPINKRVLYLQVDFGGEKEGRDFDATMLYFYLIVLREAAAKIQAKVNGILLYATQDENKKFLGVVLASDYIEVFERSYPQIRGSIDFQVIANLISENASENARQNYIEVFLHATENLGRIPFLEEFLPNLTSYVHSIEFIEQAELNDLSKRLGKVYDNNVEYLVVLDKRYIYSVVPVSLVSDEIAKSVLRLSKAYESK